MLMLLVVFANCIIDYVRRVIDCMRTIMGSDLTGGIELLEAPSVPICML